MDEADDPWPTTHISVAREDHPNGCADWVGGSQRRRTPISAAGGRAGGIDAPVLVGFLGPGMLAGFRSARPSHNPVLQLAPGHDVMRDGRRPGPHDEHRAESVAGSSPADVAAAAA